jgi:diaminohydroxyphosphoribosylaminopyrimidine deaminase / 5-amino-6-(5-phosphoribosylamino)uracil reductase
MDAISLLELRTLEEALKANQMNVTIMRPWITLSFGMSLDGKIATREGDSKYITGPEARSFVHHLRHRHDAILVGIQTVENDHPLLTTRLDNIKGKDAVRIILDSKLRIAIDEPLLNQPSDAKTMVVAKAKFASKEKVEQLTSIGVIILLDPHSSKRIHLPWLMKQLIARQIRSVMVEGGGTIHESFIRHRFVDRIYSQVSPLLIGGKKAKTPVEGLGFPLLKDATRVAFCNHFKLGQDIIIVSSNQEQE